MEQPDVETPARPVAGEVRYSAGLAVREAAPPAGVIADSTEFLLSEPIEDRYGTIVDPSWLLENYRKNPVVLWMHDRWGLPVAQGADVRLEGQRLLGRAVWAKDTPMGESLARAYSTGLLRAVSVGWKSGRVVDRAGLDPSNPYYKKDGGWGSVVFYDNDLHEFSAVTVPGLQTALATGRAYHEHATGLARAALGSDLARAAAALGIVPEAPPPVVPDTLADEDFWRVCAEASWREWQVLAEAVHELRS